MLASASPTAMLSNGSGPVSSPSSSGSGFSWTPIGIPLFYQLSSTFAGKMVIIAIYVHVGKIRRKVLNQKIHTPTVSLVAQHSPAPTRLSSCNGVQNVLLQRGTTRSTATTAKKYVNKNGFALCFGKKYSTSRQWIRQGSYISK